MKSLNYIKLIAFFPLTGLVGYHRLLLWNNGVFFGRILLFLIMMITSVFNDNLNALIFGFLIMLAFWIYDIINITKIYNKAITEIDTTVDEIIDFGVKGEYKKMFFKLFKNGKTQVYINRMMQTQKANELMKKLATNEEEVNYVISIINKRDEVAAMTFIKKKIGSDFMSFLK